MYPVGHWKFPLPVEYLMWWSVSKISDQSFKRTYCSVNSE